MCDDFFDDDMDGLDDSYSDPSNDFDEDRADDAGEWYEDDDPLVDEQADTTFSNAPGEERGFDQAEAILFGSMIVGNAIEENEDKKQRLKRMIAENKSKK